MGIFRRNLSMPLMSGFICMIIAITGMVFSAKGELYDIAVVNVI